MTIIHLAIFFGIVAGLFFPIIGKPELVIGETSIFQNQIFNVIFSLSVIFIYYFIAEYWLHGKTLGKFTTGTSVKNVAGGTPSLQAILIRSSLRLIPIEPVSFLLGKNMGWHDYFSKTIVVEDVGTLNHS